MVLKKQLRARIVGRNLSISFYNQRNIITIQTIIQLQTHVAHSNVVCWNTGSDIKIRVIANVKCFLL